MAPLFIRLREVREAKGVKQSELAARAGTRQGTISLLESGKTRRVDLDLLERVACALGVSPATLFAQDVPVAATGKTVPEKRRRRTE